MLRLRGKMYTESNVQKEKFVWKVCVVFRDADYGKIILPFIEIIFLLENLSKTIGKS